MAKLKDPLQERRPVAQRQGGIAQLGQLGPEPSAALGYARFGHDTQQGADEMLARYRIEEDRTNTLIAENTFNKLRDLQANLTNSEEFGFRQQRGADAVEKPIYKEWMQKFDDARKEVAGRLTNDDQRRKFNARAEVAKLQYQDDLMSHLATEADTYAKQVYDGTVAVEQQNAQTNWNEPQAVWASIDRIDNAIKERAERYGWKPEYIDAVRKMELGKVHAAVIQEAIIHKKWGYARKWYDKHRDEIDIQTTKALDSALTNALQKQKSADYTSQYLASENSMQALGELKSQILQDKKLDETRQNILVGRIQNREYVLERRAEIAQNKRVAKLEHRLKKLNRDTLAGYEPPAQEFQAVLDDAQGTGLEPDIEQSMRLAEQTREFRLQPPLVQDQIVTDMEAAARDPARAGQVDIDVLRAYQSIRNAQRTAVEDNPVGFGVGQGVIEPPTPLDLGKPAEQGQALAERFDIARTMQQRYGQPQMKPLTPAEVQVMTSYLQNAPVEAKRQYLADLFKASGDDVEGYTAMMAQLAPKDPVSAIAGGLGARGRSQDADILLRGQGLLAPADGSKPKIALPSESEMRKAWDANVQEVFQGNAPAREAHFQAAKAAYAALSADAGDSDTKVLDGDRWALAMKTALGEVTRYQGRRIVLPHGYDEDKFAEEATQRIYALVEGAKQREKEAKKLSRSLRLSSGEDRIIAYHRNNVANHRIGRDERGRAVTVFSTGIKIPDGPNKGKFVSVPGFLPDGRILDPSKDPQAEKKLYDYWKPTIDGGLWPMYDSGEQLNQRSQEIHKIIELDEGRIDPSWTFDRLKELPLQNVGDGRYVLRSGDATVTDEWGNPLEIDFGTPLVQPAGSAEITPYPTTPTDIMKALP